MERPRRSLRRARIFNPESQTFAAETTDFAKLRKGDQFVMHEADGTLVVFGVNLLMEVVHEPGPDGLGATTLAARAVRVPPPLYWVDERSPRRPGALPPRAA